MEKEVRYFPIEQLRAEEKDGVQKIGGYAAVFYKLSENLGGFREKVAKGAFKDSVSGGDIRAFWSHNPDFVLGRTKSNTLRVWEDDFGLAFELNLPDTSIGRDAFTTIKRGDVSGMSFGFITRKDSWERGKEGSPHIRTLLDVELLEVSPTAFPAYPQTSVAERSVLDTMKEREKEWMWEDHVQTGTKVVDVRERLAAKERAYRTKSLRNLEFVKIL